MAQHHPKICLVCSSGGHLTQLHMLESWWRDKDRLWVTFDKEDANSLLKGERVIHCFYPTNRNLRNLLRNTALAWRVLRRERPDVIVSTGAAVAVPFMYLGRLFGARTVYIEVFDRIDRPTLTGRIIRPITDLFVVQWPTMERVYKGSVNLGSIF